MVLDLIFIVIGFALLIFGANFLVDGSCGIARRFGMSDRVIGLTLVAVGTAAPEIVVSVSSAASGYADMAVGNVVGSCLANLLLILGLSAVIAPIRLTRQTQRFEVPASIAAIGLLALLANLDGSLSLIDGIILLIAFAAFMARTIVVGMREGDQEEDAEADADAPELEKAVESGIRALIGRARTHPLAAIVLIVAGIGLLKVGADLTIDHAVSLAESLGISERLIGITVIALGTCLPELITSVVAALRGNTDLAVGNVVGSNVANLLLVMGLPALVTTVPYAASYNPDLILLALATAALIAFAYIGPRHTMSRRNGIVFVLLYVAYIVAAAIM